MTTGNPALIELIRETIRAQGPQTFAWFMQQALYHPDHGYYASGHCAIGRAGDYFTNVSVGPVFGQLLAAQFAEIWERLGKPGRRGDIGDFMIVEQGAHDGQFARDVLEFAQSRAPEFFAGLRYRIVEPFPVLQERQRQTLAAFGDKIEWRDSLEPFTGVHFSNELLDAMPVRLISGGTEKLVGLDGDNFVFVERPLDPAIFNEAAIDWIDEVAANLQRAEGNGLRVAGFTDQHHFFTGIISEMGGGGSPAFVRLGELRRGRPEPPPGDWGQSPLPDSPKTKRELQTLLHPEMLGRTFQVLALSKNIAEPAERAQPLQTRSRTTRKKSDGRSWAIRPIRGIGCPPGAERVDPAASKLAGFKFAREPISALRISA